MRNNSGNTGNYLLEFSGSTTSMAKFGFVAESNFADVIRISKHSNALDFEVP